MISLLEKLKAGKRNIRIIKFPGTDQDVALQVLSNAEKQDALFATEERFKQRNIVVNTMTVDAYEDEHTTQMLARAMREPSDPSKAFTLSADELRSMITTVEKDLLVAAYNEFEKEASPSEDNLSEDELNTLFETLKKNPESGNNLSSSTLKSLIAFLASRQLN